MRTHWKRFLLMFGLLWLAAAATATMSLGRYAAEDFSLPDLTPIYLVLAVFGLPLTAIVALPALLLLRRRFESMRSAMLYPLMSALLVMLVPAAASGVGAFVFESLPVGEAILFTGAFAVMGMTFGLAFLRLYGEAWTRRWAATLACFLIAVCATAATTTILPFVEEALLASADNGSVSRGVTMSEPRSGHTATLLPDGRVLLIGGMISVRGAEVSTASTEIYDPQTGATKPSGKLSMPRAGHTATLLPDGNVLVTGGGADQKAMISAELYRAKTGEFVPVGSMSAPRERHSATLLAVGKMTAVPGQRDALIAILLEGIAGMHGCLSYVIAKDPADENAIWITEVWDSQASHKASLSLPSVKQALGPISRKLCCSLINGKSAFKASSRRNGVANPMANG